MKNKSLLIALVLAIGATSFASNAKAQDLTFDWSLTGDPSLGLGDTIGGEITLHQILGDHYTATSALANSDIGGNFTVPSLDFFSTLANQFTVDGGVITSGEYVGMDANDDLFHFATGPSASVGYEDNHGHVVYNLLGSSGITFTPAGGSGGPGGGGGGGGFAPAAPGTPAPPMTACLAFAAVLVLQALRTRKAATV